MEVYLVGGGVRDRLLGLPVKDRDWVVTGGSPDEMRARGYRQVGRDFPVFLHPETHEEYALARSERKTGRGHRGFTFVFTPQVTLEADLRRRDLTINAIAENDEGQLIDPYGGVADIENRVLRHVSPAFAEDPLRVLRLMRFSARFYPLGFTIAEETLALCRMMVTSGELDALTGQRVWQECERALGCADPQVFFAGLDEVAALAVVTFAATPDRRALRRMNARLKAACSRTQRPAERLAAWVGNDFALIGEMKTHLPLPNAVKKWLALVSVWAEKVGNWQDQSAATRWAMLKACKSLRAPGEIEALARLVGVSSPVMRDIREKQRAVRRIKPQALQAQGVCGRALGEMLKARQLDCLRD